MLDIKFVRENPELVKENIKKKFQDEKLPFVDEVIANDQKRRETQVKIDELRKNRNDMSNQIGGLMREGKKEEAEQVKANVNEINEELVHLEELESELAVQIKNRMMVIPNIMDASVPVGKDDSENVELEKFGEPVVPDYEIPYHAEIMESFGGDRKSTRLNSSHMA